jgi:hypothetical protein
MQKHLTVDRRFTLGNLVEQLDDKGKELGLIIDLTNTDRYYKATVCHSTRTIARESWFSIHE